MRKICLKILFLSVLLCKVSVLYSQNLFVKFIFTSSKSDSVSYNLKIGHKKSIFYKEPDKIMNEILAIDSCQNFNIEKVQNNIYINDNVDNLLLKTSYQWQPKWIISAEKSMIDKLEVQKAETVYNNQKWVAWFCQDIPISDGPFIFSGLPGLIIKATDENGNVFNVLSISNVKNEKKNICSKARRKDINLSKYKELITRNNIMEQELLNKLTSIKGINVNKNNLNKDNNPIRTLLLQNDKNK